MHYIIIGDFNMKSVLLNANDYNEKLIEHLLEKHNMKQYVNTRQQKMDLFWTCAFQIVQILHM